MDVAMMVNRTVPELADLHVRGEADLVHIEIVANKAVVWSWDFRLQAAVAMVRCLKGDKDKAYIFDMAASDGHRLVRVKSSDDTPAVWRFLTRNDDGWVHRFTLCEDAALAFAWALKAAVVKAMEGGRN